MEIFRDERLARDWTSIGVRPRMILATRQLATVALIIVCSGCGPTREQLPNILLITLDTTRADRLPCYGYETDTAPRLCELAEDAELFTNCYAVSSWTLPTHASILTGKLPSAHGAMYDPEGSVNLTQGIKGHPSWSSYRAQPLSQEEETLATVLGRAGYETGAVVAGPWLRRVFGLDLGFDTYDDSNFVDLTSRGLGELNGRPAEDVTRAALEFVIDHRDGPFFLFLNYFDPHTPWLPPEEYLQRFWHGPAPQPITPAFQNALYDAEIAYMDAQVGELLDHLRKADLYENAWIIVTADHGDLIGDNGLWGHGKSLTEAEIHIPLIVKEPGGARRRGRNGWLVQQTDLLPTLLDRLQLPSLPHLQGRALGHRRLSAVAEVYPLPFMGSDLDRRQQGDRRMIFDGTYKLVWSSLGHHALFDLTEDPGETTNLLTRRPEVGQRLEHLLQAYFASLPKPDAVEVEQDVDEETLRLLRSLGYLGDG